MNIHVTALFAVLCCSISLQPQTQTKVPFAGCYEIVSQTWYPLNEDASPIPGRFQLQDEPADKRSTGIFQMRRIPVGHNMMERLWFWRPKGDHLWLSWGTGLGGFRGTLRQSREDEFIGKVKEWCDSHCEWKTRVAKIRIRTIDCAE